MLHGIRRFSIYYCCYINSSSIIENIHVAIAGYRSIVNSIFHLHVLKRAQLLIAFF